MSTNHYLTVNLNVSSALLKIPEIGKANQKQKRSCISNMRERHGGFHFDCSAHCALCRKHLPVAQYDLEYRPPETEAWEYKVLGCMFLSPLFELKQTLIRLLSLRYRRFEQPA